MTITFCIESRTDTEDEALATENAPEFTVHLAGGWTLLAALGIDPDHYGTIDADDLLARLDAGTVEPLPEHVDANYITERLDWLREVAEAAHRLGRQVVWS